MEVEAGVSFGSNLGDRYGMIRAAVDRLVREPGIRLLAASPLYETEPVDVPEAFADTAYVNGVAVFATTLSPEAFSDRCHAVEDALGRVRTGYHHPRTIDIDILFVGDAVRDRPHLRLPHPQIASRRFVCRPLADIRPDFRLPGGGPTVRECLARLPVAPRVRRSLVLASASPRRRKLLAAAGVPFEVRPTGATEVDESGDVVATVRANAALKYRAARAACPFDRILAADTAIGFEGRVIGKPRDAEDALAMLTAFSGKVQMVVTGVAFGEPGVAAPEVFHVRSYVRFRPFSRETAEAYLAAGDMLDRAGAYDIASRGDLLIESCEGSRANVEGLPIERVLEVLAVADSRL